jgi:hypothetical protein
MKERQEKEAERERDTAVNALTRWGQSEQTEEVIDEYRHRRLTNPAKCQRCDRDTELRSGDISVEMLERFLNVAGPRVAGFRHLIDSASSHRDKRELGSDKEGVQRYQKQNDTKAGSYLTHAEVFGQTLKKGQEIHIQ